MPESTLDTKARIKDVNFATMATQATKLHKPSYFVETYLGKSGTVAAKASAILTDPRYNKMTAFTEKERESLGLVGLLPPTIETIDVQVQRAYKQLMRFTAPLSQHIYLSSLRERSETLFYKLVLTYFEEVVPIIYTPTVGQACLEYGLQFRFAEGMYISAREKGKIRSVLNNWKSNIHDEIAIIVVTDGSRVLGLGDLGVCGMGISIGKLALYVAGAGFHPSTTLPMVVDVGTENEILRNDELYVGLRQPPLNDKEYFELFDEFMVGVYDRWPHVLVQFEDFSNNHCFALLEKYKNKYLCFNDDIQGTGIVIAAGFLNALKICNLDPENCRVIFVGAGSAGVGVAQQIIRTLSHEYSIPEERLQKMFYLIDTKGLVVMDRVEKLQSFKIPFARIDYKSDDVKSKGLLELIQMIKPQALIGLSGQPNIFTPEILQYMSTHNPQPIIFPLSNPTSKTECTFEDAIKYSDGRVVFASGSPFAPVTYKGNVHYAPQGNNLYAFPGLGFGAWLSWSKYISDNMLLEVTKTLAATVRPEDLEQKLLYPSLKEIREVSVQISAAVMRTAYAEGLSQLKEQPDDYTAYVRSCQYVPMYLQDIEN